MPVISKKRFDSTPLVRARPARAHIIALLCGAAIPLGWTPALATGCHNHLSHPTDAPEIIPTRVTIQHAAVVATFSIFPGVDFIHQKPSTYSGSTYVQLDRNPITIFRSDRSDVSGDYTVSFKSLPPGAHVLRIWIESSTDDIDAGFEACFRTPTVKTLTEPDFPYSIYY